MKRSYSSPKPESRNESQSQDLDCLRQRMLWDLEWFLNTMINEPFRRIQIICESEKQYTVALN